MSEAASAVLSNPAANPATQPDAEPAADQSARSRVSELRVSGHLMTLEQGVFCVFPAPGATQADPTTGLPGVRITRSPGSAASAVSIATFSPDGWLDGAAALVRVNDPVAQILVTVYQSSHQGPESAPRLQIMRLSNEPMPGEAPAAPARAPAAAVQPIVPGEDPQVIAHIQQTGDVGGTLGEWMGKRDSKLWIEGFGLKPTDMIKPSDIEYQAVLGRGWLSPWVDGGNFCGSRGMALPLLGINIRLKGDAADEYECHYSATFVDGTAVGPTPAGQACEAESLAALEAFQVEIRPLAAAGSQAPAPRKQAATRTAAAKSPAKPKAPARTTRR